MIARLLVSSSLSPPDVTLLGDGELGTLAAGQGDPWLGALADDEDVGDPDVWISIGSDVNRI